MPPTRCWRISSRRSMENGRSIGETSTSSRSTRSRAPTSTRRSSSRWTPTTWCCRTPSPTWRASSNPAARSTRRRGDGASPSISPTAGPTLYPPAPFRRRGEPAARRRTTGDRVPCAGRPDGEVGPRRRRAFGHPEPGEVGLRHGRRSPTSRRHFAELARRIEPPRRPAEPTASNPPSRRWSGATGFELRFRPRREIERQSAALSLATNMAVADRLLAARTGLFRTMDGRRRRPAAPPAPHRSCVRARLARRGATRRLPPHAAPRMTRAPVRSSWRCAAPVAAPATSPTARGWCRGTRRSPPPTATPRRHCAGSVTGT